jgi:ribosomal protein L12E/L44/L45/RPP1/RPP2
MLGNLKNMFKPGTSKKSKKAAPKAEAPAPKAKAAAPKAEKPAAKKEKTEKKGGFNLFGLLDNSGSKQASKPQPTVNYQNTSSDEYFLSADDAKTYGDIDYMRTAKAVRKSFPKMGGSKEGAEIEVIVSNLVEEKANAATKAAASTAATPSFDSFTPSSRAKVDTNMDMFRNMAKGIKKR